MISLSALFLTVSGPAVEAPVRFRDVARGAGVAVRNVSGSPEKRTIVESTGSGACFFDYDQDGSIDLYVVNGARFDEPASPGGHSDRLFRNAGDGTFRDVTEAAGIDDRGWGGGCTVGDVDNDGDPDLYVTNFGPNLLYSNLGDGTFRDVTAAAGVSAPVVSSSSAFGDLDGDGFLDLVVGSYLRFDEDVRFPCPYRGVEVYCGPDGLPGASNFVFRNLGDGTFEDRTEASGMRQDRAKTLGVILSDLDGDGRLDVYAACDSTINLLFRNEGGFRFRDLSLLSGAGFSGQGFEQSGMGVAAGDPDADGDLDLIVTNFHNDRNTVYANLGGADFEDVTDRWGLAAPTLDFLAWGVHFLDLDNDGDEDLYLANGHVYPQAEAIGEPYRQRNQVFLNQEGKGWVEIEGVESGEKLPGSSRGTAVADFDDDGRLDLYVSQIDDQGTLLRAEGSAEGRWLKLLLVGMGSNRDGLGARVVLSHAGGRAHRELRFSDGYLGASEPRMHFGLGDSAAASSVVLRWPSGKEQVIGPLEAGFTYLVKEGVGVVP